ncbi:unnamed protein product, partial [Oikopleura dioica]
MKKLIWILCQFNTAKKQEISSWEAVSLMANISNSANLECSESTQMLVIVNSNIRRIQRRTTIRTNWKPTDRIERVFLLGIPAGYDTRQIPAYKEMQKEVEKHGDGIVLN